MADFKPKELEQVTYVFNKIVEAKKWEDRAAGAGVFASAGDVLHKAIHAYEKYVKGQEKDKDFSTFSKWMVTIGIGGGAAAKALQDFYKWRAAANTPSKAESDLASKFMPSKDGDYEKIVELLISNTNGDIIAKGNRLFGDIDTKTTNFNNTYDEIKDSRTALQKDKTAATEIKKKFPDATKTASIKNAFEEAVGLYNSGSQTEKKSAMDTINKKYKEGQKILITIKGCCNDITAINKAQNNRTNGRTLYQATETAFNFIAAQYGDLLPGDHKKSAEKNAKDAKTKKDMNINTIEWNFAANYYWVAYRMAKTAIQAFTTAIAEIEDETKRGLLNSAKEVLENIINPNQEQL